MTSTVFLDNLRFYAYHGVGEQERKVGNEFMLSLRLETPLFRAIRTDDLADTISYAAVYGVVKQEVEIPSKLLEHVAGRIVKRLFREFPSLERVELKLSKRNPPMEADMEAAGVEIQCHRSDFTSDE